MIDADIVQSSGGNGDFRQKIHFYFKSIQGYVG